MTGSEPSETDQPDFGEAVHVHVGPRRLEIRNDPIATADAQSEWATFLSPWMCHALAYLPADTLA